MKKRTPSHLKIHPRNKHLGNYDFDVLVKTLPQLKPFVKHNKYGNQSIDFFNPEAVKYLNKALLKHFYKIDYWDIPQNFLCPPIPGRADYVHHIADFLASKNLPKKNIPTGAKIKCLDIGVGANCIYPILGNAEYGWSFIGSDINQKSLQSAEKIVQANEQLKNNVILRRQTSPKNILKGILKAEEKIDITFCNPPFHTSAEDASKGSLRKLNNLKGQKQEKLVLNFGGQHNELWCKGGEVHFIKIMLNESKAFAQNVFFFSTLVSKEAHLKSIYQMLRKAKVQEMKTIKMAQGNKQSRLVAWTFLNPEEQLKWVTERF